MQLVLSLLLSFALVVCYYVCLLLIFHSSFNWKLKSLRFFIDRQWNYYYVGSCCCCCDCRKRVDTAARVILMKMCAHTRGRGEVISLIARLSLSLSLCKQTPECENVFSPPLLPVLLLLFQIFVAALWWLSALDACTSNENSRCHKKNCSRWCARGKVLITIPCEIVESEGRK